MTDRSAAGGSSIGALLFLTLVTAVATAAAIGHVLWSGGRDFRWRRQVVARSTPSPRDTWLHIPLLEPLIVPAEYEPPDNLPPGLLGVLVDERVNARDFGATVVDLARRGVLSVTHLPGPWWQPSDWLIRYHPAAAGDLLPFERVLIERWFGHHREITSSSLRRHFSTSIWRFQEALDLELLQRGWFMERISEARRTWFMRSVPLLSSAYVLQAFMFALGEVAIVTLPLPLGALVLPAFHNRMGRRTPTGRALTIRALGFRRFILDAEARRAAFAEEAGVYYDYLPYAIAFGATRSWGAQVPASVALGRVHPALGRVSQVSADRRDGSASAVGAVPSPSAWTCHLLIVSCARGWDRHRRMLLAWEH